MINYQLAFLLGIGAYVYTNWLTEPRMIFNWLYIKLLRLTEDNHGNESPWYLYSLFMVLIGCEKCVAGQWALWVFLFINWHDYTPWFILPHALTVLFTIFVAGATKFIINKITNE